MKRSEDILELLKKDAEQLEIPEGLKPEQMLRRLERNEEWKEENEWKEKANPRKKWDWTRKRYKALATAACIFLVFGGALAVWQQGYLNTENISDELCIILYFLCSIIGGSICIASYHFIRKISPGIVNVLTGNR